MSNAAYQETDPQSFVHGPAVTDQLRRRAESQPDQLYGVEQGEATTLAELDRLVDTIADRLEKNGVGPQTRVGVGLPTTIHHAAIILALFRRRALWVPVNPQLKGIPLAHQVDDAELTHLITETGSDFAERVQRAANVTTSDPLSDGVDLWHISREYSPAALDGVEFLMYTSGTTGSPKGVQVSASMLRACVLGALHVTEVRDGDVLYLWEPLFHIGGAQTMLLPLYADVHLVFTPRFSASRFWSDVVRHNVTHIHYLGGVLQILLNLPVSEDEKHHQVRVAWGAGATEPLWAAAQERYGFAVHECYGSTETSSIVTVNKNELSGGVGAPLPWFDLELHTTAEGTDRPLNQMPHAEGSTGQHIEPRRGEITVRSSISGLITSGYLNRAEATEKSLRPDGWFRTGDLGSLDPQGRLHFHGRANDSVRVRGENVSAWQVEDVFSQHPAVDRCAVVGVEATVGEQEMLLILTPVEDTEPDLQAVLAWGAEHLAKFQLPRFAKLIDEMPLTPSQRVVKHRLPLSLKDAVKR